MSRIRLNNEKRDKLFKVARNFRMNDTTDVKLEKMRQAKENCDNDLPKFFQIHLKTMLSAQFYSTLKQMQTSSNILIQRQQSKTFCHMWKSLKTLMWRQTKG